jgi:hypothetical protein
MNARQWTTLVSELQDGRCILVLGPEVPMSTAPEEHGESVVEAVADQLRSILNEESVNIPKTTLAATSQHYADYFTEHEMRSMVASMYKDIESNDPSYIHSLIAALPFHLILTTAHDNLLSKAMHSVGKQPVNKSFRLRGIASHSSAILPPDAVDTEFGCSYNPETPNIYHLFGAAGEPNEMVISEEDITDFFLALIREKAKRIPVGMASMMQRNSHRYLFLGFGIRQLHLRVLIKLFIKALVDNPMRNPYLVTESLRGLQDDEIAQTIGFFKRGTKIEVENDSLVSFLEELLKRFQQAGGYNNGAVRLQAVPEQSAQITVFISYVHEDVHIVRRLFKGIEEAGLRPWMDEVSLEGGRRWDPELKEQIDSADFVVVVMSPTLARKTDSYVNKEIDLAIERSKRIRSSSGSFLVPLALSGLRSDHVIPELEPFHRLQLRDDTFAEDLARLVSDLKKNYQRRARG